MVINDGDKTNDINFTKLIIRLIIAIRSGRASRREEGGGTWGRALALSRRRPRVRKLYTYVYPRASVRPRESCVVRARYNRALIRGRQKLPRGVYRYGLIRFTLGIYVMNATLSASPPLRQLNVTQRATRRRIRARRAGDRDRPRTREYTSVTFGWTTCTTARVIYLRWRALLPRGTVYHFAFRVQ